MKSAGVQQTHHLHGQHQNTKVKTMRVSMPRPSPRIIEQDTAGDDRPLEIPGFFSFEILITSITDCLQGIRWEMPRHVPSATIGSAPQSLAGALMDNEVADENEVPEAGLFGLFANLDP